MHRYIAQGSWKVVSAALLASASRHSLAVLAKASAILFICFFVKGLDATQRFGVAEALTRMKSMLKIGFIRKTYGDRGFTL